MRFSTAFVAALTVVSIGVQAAPAPQETSLPPQSLISTSLSVPVSTDSPITVPSTPVPSPTFSSTSVEALKPTGKIEDKHEHKPVVKEPEYELVCKDVAFFHNWDIYWADVSHVPCWPETVTLTNPGLRLQLPSGRTNGTCIYDCAKDLVKDKK